MRKRYRYVRLPTCLSHESLGGNRHAHARVARLAKWVGKVGERATMAIEAVFDATVVSQINVATAYVAITNGEVESRNARLS
jgi:hypothetical protein